MSRMTKKAQNWSLDLILGIVIFVLILSVFYMLLSKSDSADVTLMKNSGHKVLNSLDSKSSGMTNTFVDGNKINMSQLEELYRNGDYDAIKQDLGLNGDFCIILEDKNGNVISVVNGTKYIYGFGNGEVNISSCPCGQSCD